MDFSTEGKTITRIAEILSEEIIQQIGAGEIRTAEEIESKVREVFQEIGKETCQKVLEAEDDQLGNEIKCKCDGKAKRILRREATTLTVFGIVRYKRSYYKCERCKKKQYEIDEKYGIKPGEVSEVLKRLLAIIGVDIAFERAKRTVKELLLLEVSDNTIRKQTQQIGEMQAEIEDKWIEKSQDENWLQERERKMKEKSKRMYGSIDGAHVPVGEEYRELKTICWYQLEKVYGKERFKAQKIDYHSEIATAKEFGSLFWATGLRRMVDQAEELIFVCDGATWIWKMVERYFPDAVQIVDWYHACEYLTPIADSAFSKDDEKENWLSETKDKLWAGSIEEVIQACENMKNDAAEPVGNAISYFRNHAHRMKYAKFREKGYCIGSGIVESACKQIAAARLKISGARWTLEGAISTAKARAAWLSDGNGFQYRDTLPLAG